MKVGSTYEMPDCKTITLGTATTVLSGSPVSAGGWEGTLDDTIDNITNYGNGLE